MFQNNSTDKKEKKQNSELHKKNNQDIQTQKKDTKDYKADLSHFDEATKLIDEIISTKPLDKEVVESREIEDTEFFEVLHEETPIEPNTLKEKDTQTPIKQGNNDINTSKNTETSHPTNQSKKQKINQKNIKKKEKKKLFSIFGTKRIKIKTKQPKPNQINTQKQAINPPPIMPGDHEIQQDEKRKELEKKKPKKKVGFFSKKQIQKQTTAKPQTSTTPSLPTPKQTIQLQPKEECPPTPQSQPSTITPPPPIMKEQINQESLVDDDIRKVLLITDELLGKLPEQVIEEFASSKDFDLYQKVMYKYHIK